MDEDECKLEELSKTEPYASLVRALRRLEKRIAALEMIPTGEAEAEKPINNAVMSE